MVVHNCSETSTLDVALCESLMTTRKKNIRMVKKEGKKQSKQTSPTELPPVRSRSPSRSSGMQKTLVTKC